ncbi:MAG: hypothetical protein ACPGPS_04115 [Rubripirellula sp.]
MERLTNKVLLGIGDSLLAAIDEIRDEKPRTEWILDTLVAKAKRAGYEVQPQSRRGRPTAD